MSVENWLEVAQWLVILTLNILVINLNKGENK